MAAATTAIEPSDDLLATIRSLIEQVAADRDREDPPTRQVDEHAAELIREFLDENGWSVRRFSQETEQVARRHNKPDLTVSRRTLDRILEDDRVPHPRVKAGIALVMGVPPWRIWGKGQMPLAYQREQILMEASK